MSENQIKTKVSFPISAKLVIIISVLVVLSLGAVIALVSFLSTADVRRTAEYNNFTINSQTGSQAKSTFESMQAAVLFYLNMTDRITRRDSGIERDFFSHNMNIAALSAGSALIANEEFLFANNLNQDDIKSYFDTRLAGDLARADRITLQNASSFFGQPLLGAIFVRRNNSGNETIKILFAADDLGEAFGTGTNTSFIVNDIGDLLLHPDIDLVTGGVNYSSLPIVAEVMSEGVSGKMQISFADRDGINYFGAYNKLAGTNVTVITTIPHSVVFEAVQRVTIQNIFLTGVVLFLAILFIWFFSKTLSSPLRVLADAALQIEGGEFGIDLSYKSRDELGLLTKSFTKMAGALNIFGRFTNRDLAVRAMRGEIKPGGLSKHATIFFSDIRGFTEKSENFTKAFGEDASNRIIMWLNEYFTYMVECVEKTGGVVDKFIGDAVMAHWGTAYTAGSPEQDAFNCVKAALMMRNALYKLNQKRDKNDPGSPPIQIGCGINSGIVTAGQLGSDKRMEYTVIGDPVNLASRTEALNKPLGTDILITEDTWLLTGDKFITEEMPPVTVKGKEKPVRMFAVVNIKGASGAPHTLAEVRKILGIATPDLSKVDTNAEEKKYKIKSD
jgi:adenylate cyclase